MESEILIIHIIFFRSNYVLIISNIFGRVLFMVNAGKLGFKNIQKRTVEVLKMILISGFKFILGIGKNNYLFLKLEGTKKLVFSSIFKQFLNLIKKYNFKFLGTKIINKIAHNGCRKKRIK